jgi:2-oxoglutarate ferredoxin oxidoreductase subunit delta
MNTGQNKNHTKTEKPAAESDVNEKTTVEINREWCKGCGICVAFCPEKVLGLDENEKAVALNPENCVFCGMCELRCPDMAVEVTIKIE